MRLSENPMAAYLEMKGARMPLRPQVACLAVLCVIYLGVIVAYLQGGAEAVVVYAATVGGLCLALPRDRERPPLPETDGHRAPPVTGHGVPTAR